MPVCRPDQMRLPATSVADAEPDHRGYPRPRSSVGADCPRRTCGLVAPFRCIHADPVAQVFGRHRRPSPREELGSPFGVWPVASPVASGHPVARFSAVAAFVAPVARTLDAQRVVSRSVPEPLSHREPRSVFPDPRPKAGLRTRFVTPVCVRSPVRGIPWRTQNPRSRGISKFTELSPELFVHPQETCRRPPFMHNVVPRTSGCSAVIGQLIDKLICELIDEQPTARLNGPRDAHRTLRFRDHHHSVEHVAIPRARSAARRAAFLLPELKVMP